jgi:hypothetical protein
LVLLDNVIVAPESHNVPGGWSGLEHMTGSIWDPHLLTR